MLKLLKKIDYRGRWAIAVAAVYALFPSTWGAEGLPLSQRVFWVAVAGIGFWAMWTGLDWLKDNRPRTTYGITLGLNCFLIASGAMDIEQGQVAAGVLFVVGGVLLNLVVAFAGPPKPKRPDIDDSRGPNIEMPEDSPPFVCDDSRGPRIEMSEQDTPKIDI